MADQTKRHTCIYIAPDGELSEVTLSDKCGPDWRKAMLKGVADYDWEFESHFSSKYGLAIFVVDELKEPDPEGI